MIYEYNTLRNGNNVVKHVDNKLLKWYGRVDRIFHGTPTTSYKIYMNSLTERKNAVCENRHLRRSKTTDIKGRNRRSKKVNN